MITKIKGLLFKNTGTSQTVLKNTFWLSFGQISGRLIRAAVIIYAARMLGVAEYGVFSYVLGLAGFFSVFSDIGVSSILTREAAKRPENRAQIFATTFWIKMALLLGTAAAIMLFAPSFSKIEAARALIPFVAFLVIFDGIRDFSLSFIRALEKMEIDAFVNILTNIAITVSGFIILALSATAQALTITYVLSSGVGALIIILVLRKEFGKIFSDFDRKLIRPIIAAAIPLALLGFLGSFMLNLDMIMLGWWRTATELGYYSAAQRVLQIFYIFPPLLSSALFPTLVRLIGQGKEGKVREMAEQTITLLFAIAIPLTIGGIILAKPFMAFIYGGEYAPAAAAFRFLMVTLLFIFPASILGNLAFAYNKQMRFVTPVAIASIGNFAFNALLIPSFGIVGCSIATIIALLAQNIITWRIIKREVIAFKTLRHLPRIVAGATGMGIITFLLEFFGLPIIPNIVVSVALYVGLLFLFREPLIRQLRATLGSVWAQ